ncbi:WSSV357 [White spot syndrome virus]|uniref:WSSV357 n=1 Tax=White spot syndrome virus TaxID=342409 RepID=A0A2I6SC72_9VIRU|nr:WSSV357 [White spot syndrome virus]
MGGNSSAPIMMKKLLEALNPGHDKVNNKKITCMCKSYPPVHA